MCVRMCACVICTYIRLGFYVFAFTYTQKIVNACMYTYKRIVRHIYIHTHSPTIHVYLYIQANSRTYSHAHTHTHMVLSHQALNRNICICMHVYMCVWVCVIYTRIRFGLISMCVLTFTLYCRIKPSMLSMVSPYDSRTIKACIYAC